MTDAEMGQLVIDLQPLLVIPVVAGNHLISKKRQHRITCAREKPHQSAVGKQVDPAIETDQIKKDKEGCDQERDIGVGPDVDKEIDPFQDSQRPERQPGRALPVQADPADFIERPRIGISAAEKQIKNIKRRERDKAEAHIVPDPVAVDQRRSPDEPDFIK